MNPPTTGGSSPAAVPANDESVREHLKTLEERTYTTYRARESACVRLERRARAWNWALVALSTATTVAAIGTLTDPLMYGHRGSTLLVCVSVLTLVVSLATTNIDHSGRARDMFLNYRKLQRLSVEMEELHKCAVVTYEAMKALADRYQAVLDESENHTSGDYYRNLSTKYREGHPLYLNKSEPRYKRHCAKLGDSAINSLPYAFLLLPLVLLVPLLKTLIP